MLDLKTDIKFLQGVGPKRAILLNKEIEIFTLEDLLYYFPYKHIDKSKFYRIDEIEPDSAYIQVKGKILSFENVGKGKGQRLKAMFSDETGEIELVWFKGTKWILDKYKIGKEYVVFGKPSVFNRIINIIHPEIEEFEKFEAGINAALQAQYSTTEKLREGFVNSKAISKMIQSILQKAYTEISETLPAYIIERYKLISLREALLNIHFPKNTELLKKAQNRLKFEELFYIQLNILRYKQNRSQKVKGNILHREKDHYTALLFKNLDFQLTKAQIKVLQEIRADVISGRQMNRLLQGDVGSGKTLVGLLSMLMAVDNGYQTAIMAPTEILANQHYETISEFTKTLGLNVKLLTGSTKKSVRNIIHEELQNGILQILIGTHALIEDTVVFKNLGMVIIDEQHRFGVAQRAKLWKKNNIPPHVLVMTATPIPRTLSMTVYGDLDVSVIDELPPGRKPVKTLHFYDSKRLRLFEFMRQEIAKGRQIYIVYPLINESEKLDYKFLEDGLESISRAFPSPKYAISVVHGQMKPIEKDKAMQLFVSGKTHIMIATTVIEVGVNVPNASVMVIESAERFGLSQLHQLRGRVGRGAEQSYCILMSSYKLSKDGMRRLETMTQTNDGFEIAEIDMNLRGPGDLEGTQQSGFAFDLKIAKLTEDSQIMQYSRMAAEFVLDNDLGLSKPENMLLVKGLRKLTSGKLNWGEIS
ncbi:MAG TPA: ATP-dependent DNA helicase RecG [Bacteroidales bacterium]|nr:MAG: ATP-dependent DNA helicase RecG [Bacteroidetes bacterium GWF2_33_38]OFY89201.1 MAG: ATP-dependent DNA helicase RecG [Bacteroidetes bacterium RIFOXYA2_FULL_33_7]HBF87616.1 ATP-dependent DNA helicase RecG [Bacteroidales bacterium]